MSLLDWWQHLPLGFDGVFFSIGSFQIQYYGLMYMIGFAVCYFLVKKRMNLRKDVEIESTEVDDLFFGLIMMVIVGGRLGYVLFYNFDYFLVNPLEIVWPFKNGEFVGISGMSFHGGLLACLMYGWYFLKTKGLDFWKVSDLIMSVAPLGYFFGRLGNFLNNELYGRVTESPIGMYFKEDPNMLRYPSQLFQGVVEGFGLFVVLSYLYKNRLAENKLVAMAIIWFGAARFVLEFFREPDAHLGLYLGLSRGQMLSLLMILIGVSVWLIKSQKDS
jgi:phosphatidylglycerol:prolipoprotein diacylglycerol transferase